MYEVPTVAPLDDYYRQKEIGRASGFPQLLERWQENDYEVAIVGTGPTLFDTVDELRARLAAGLTHAVCAVKGAHDWLLERGIRPTFAVSSEPRVERVECFRYLQPETVYLMASHCHPDNWPRLRGHRVLVWHCELQHDDDRRPGWEGVPHVKGGPSSGLRAMPIMWLLGSFRQRLYGMDCTVLPDGTWKVTGDRVPPHETIEAISLSDGGAAPEAWDRKYLSTRGLWSQAQSLRMQLMHCPGIKVTAAGDGLLQGMLERGRRAGWPIW